VKCGTLENLNLDLIKSMCEPAPFGDLKTMQTKVDTNVRDALECSSDRQVCNEGRETRKKIRERDERREREEESRIMMRCSGC
jgi:hypothetical protein